MRRALMIGSCWVFLTTPPAFAQKGKAFTEAGKAGPDLEIQGEYVGKVNDDGDHTIGVQVIALGNGEFRAVAHHGGLPGAGWNGEERVIAEGAREGGVVRVVTGDNASGVIQDGVLTAYDPDGVKVGEFTRTVRKSPTLGAKPPEGSIVLFDGSSAREWNGGKIVEEKLLSNGVSSKRKFRDFQLHLEFRTPFMPDSRGQARGNSGCYLQGKYELQILDSFGLEGKNNECGGLYSLKDPDVNMCLPPLSWQTFDVDFKAARFDDSGQKVADAVITVRHNGVLIHNGYRPKKGTPPKPTETAEPGPIQLQNHGNPVYFRNIWIVEK